MPKLTNLVNFCEHLFNQLMLIDINANTAVNLALNSKMRSWMWWWMEMSTFPSFQTLKSTGCSSLMDVPLLKSLLASLKLKAQHKKPNYLVSSSHEWLLKQAATLVMVPFYQKEQFTYLPHKCTNKSWRRITFSWPGGDNSSYFGVWCMVPSHRPELNLQNWTDLIKWTPPLKAVVSMNLIGRLQQMFSCYLVTTQPNLPKVRAWIGKNLESLIHKSTRYCRPTVLFPPMQTWQAGVLNH